MNLFYYTISVTKKQHFFEKPLAFCNLKVYTIENGTLKFQVNLPP
nr:MAG TPA: hypothetical protein [Caudoviricetes sp.]